MKKQIGLIALSTLIVACVAFSGVASAQASGVQVYFFESPYCGVCNQVRPLMESAAAQTGARVTYYDMSTSPGAGIGKANGVTETPTIVIQGGQTLVGAVTEQQIVSAIQAASGTVVKSAATPTATPTPPAAKVVKSAVTPTATPVKATTVKQSTTAATTYTGAVVASKNSNVYHVPTCFEAKKILPKNQIWFPNPQAAADAGYRPCKECFPHGGPEPTKAVAESSKQPSIQVVTATQTPATSTQTVPEFSLLGLGAPALLIGAIYLFLRRR